MTRCCSGVRVLKVQVELQCVHPRLAEDSESALDSISRADVLGWPNSLDLSRFRHAPGDEVLSGLAQRIGMRLASAFGQRLRHVGKPHRAARMAVTAALLLGRRWWARRASDLHSRKG